MGRRGGFSQAKMKFLRDEERRQMKRPGALQPPRAVSGCVGAAGYLYVMSVAGRVTHPSTDAHVPTPEPVTQSPYTAKGTLRMGLRG